jgi:hypothetical protein
MFEMTAEQFAQALRQGLRAVSSQWKDDELKQTAMHYHTSNSFNKTAPTSGLSGREAVLELLTQRGPMSAAELAAEFGAQGRRPNSASLVTSVLVQEGKIKRNPDRKYQIV